MSEAHSTTNIGRGGQSMINNILAEIDNSLCQIYSDSATPTLLTLSILEYCHHHKTDIAYWIAENGSLSATIH